jgi:hypothetical protein
MYADEVLLIINLKHLGGPAGRTANYARPRQQRTAALEATLSSGWKVSFEVVESGTRIMGCHV